MNTITEPVPSVEVSGMRKIIVRKTGSIRPTAACGCYHPTFL